LVSTSSTSSLFSFATANKTVVRAFSCEAVSQRRFWGGGTRKADRSQDSVVLRERRTLKPYSFPKDMTTMTICSLSKKMSGEAVSITVEGRRLEVVECVGVGFDFLPIECEKREIVVQWEAQPIRELGKVLIHQPSTIKLWIDRQAA
jgi:hypothetical protein